MNCGSRGQASTEYALVLALTVLILVLSSMAPSPIQQLIDAVKSAWSAFSYVMSYSI